MTSASPLARSEPSTLGDSGPHGTERGASCNDGGGVKEDGCSNPSQSGPGNASGVWEVTEALGALGRGSEKAVSGSGSFTERPRQPGDGPSEREMLSVHREMLSLKWEQPSEERERISKR